MPETFGKRARRAVKDRKAQAREERRVARNQRRDDRAAGVLEPGPPVEAAEPLEPWPAPRDEGEGDRDGQG
jgi:hypothetical protein